MAYTSYISVQIEVTKLVCQNEINLYAGSPQPPPRCPNMSSAFEDLVFINYILVKMYIMYVIQALAKQIDGHTHSFTIFHVLLKYKKEINSLATVCKPNIINLIFLTTL
jgi:hypothetical protein